MSFDDTLSGARQELRRGTLVPACLLLLRRPGYGYALIEELAGLGFEVDASTLYPLLRRLEGQGIPVSQWNPEESRPRNVHPTTPDRDRPPPHRGRVGRQPSPRTARADRHGPSGRLRADRPSGVLLPLPGARGRRVRPDRAEGHGVEQDAVSTARNE